MYIYIYIILIAILLHKRQTFKNQYEQKIRKVNRIFELIKVLRQPDYININKVRYIYIYIYIYFFFF